MADIPNGFDDGSVKKREGFGGSNQRKLMISRIENILQSSLPMDKNKMVAKIEYETGLTEDKVKEYIRLFFKLGKIRKRSEDEGILEWVKD